MTFDQLALATPKGHGTVLLSGNSAFHIPVRIVTVWSVINVEKIYLTSINQSCLKLVPARGFKKLCTTRKDQLSRLSFQFKVILVI